GGQIGALARGCGPAWLPSRSRAASSKARSSASTSTSRSAEVVRVGTTGRLFFAGAADCVCMVMASPLSASSGGHDVPFGVLLLERDEAGLALGRRGRRHVALEAV